MKKVYSKPQIVFDSFELSQSIAANCDVITNYAEKVCPVDYKFGNKTVKLFMEAPCKFTAQGHYDNPCYHVPVTGEAIFSS